MCVGGVSVVPAETEVQVDVDGINHSGLRFVNVVGGVGLPTETDIDVLKLSK